MSKIIIGVIGPGASATKEDIDSSYKIGQLIAQEGWVLLTGGRNEGVMDSASKGAKKAGGLTIGIMPTSDPKTISSAVDIPIITDMQSGRNNINILSSVVIIVCGMGAGTASEVALALKADKKVILFNQNEITKKFFQGIGKDKIITTETPKETIQQAKKALHDANS